jgi:hypothetical protein
MDPDDQQTDRHAAPQHRRKNDMSLIKFTALGFAVHVSREAAVRSLKDRIYGDGDKVSYIMQGASSRAHAVGGSLYGLPDKPEGFEVPEGDRPASVTTGPDAIACKLRQYQRIAGIKGVAVLARTPVTAQGRTTHSIRLDACGLSPSDQIAAQAPEVGGKNDMVFVARYRGVYRGAEFAKSMARAEASRSRKSTRRTSPSRLIRTQWQTRFAP